MGDLKREMETGQVEIVPRRAKGWALGLGILLVTSFVLVQPMQVDSTLFPTPNNCKLRLPDTVPRSPEDPVSLNTIKSGNIIKTIYAEKEVFDCQRDPGNLDTIADLTIIAEIFEDIDTRSVLIKRFTSVICLKNNATAVEPKVIDCSTQTVNTGELDLINCIDRPLEHPQEINTVKRGKIVKTIEMQKEVFLCDPDDLPPDPSSIPSPLDSDDRKISVVIFTEIWEDLSLLPGDTITQKTFEAFVCVISMTSHSDHRCAFKPILD